MSDDQQPSTLILDAQAECDVDEPSGATTADTLAAMLALTFALYMLWLFGLMMAAIDPKKRALHDRLAKTKVVST